MAHLVTEPPPGPLDENVISLFTLFLNRSRVIQLGHWRIEEKAIKWPSTLK